jgi:hypothetical protein
VWGLVAKQHGVVTRQQLCSLGFSSKEIKTRIANRRLHPLWRGVYAVGRPDVPPEGRWLAAVLACGRNAFLSDGSAAALWGIGGYEAGGVEVSVPPESLRRHPGIRVRRRRLAVDDVTERAGIPVTTPLRTVIDLATRLDSRRLEQAINEGANRDLFTPDELREAVGARSGRPGIRRLRQVLDRRTFRLTRSDLERRFLPIADAAGLPPPETRAFVSGYEVDFYWPDLGLVVETDGLRYHRTPAQQARDRLRDQAHTVAGLTPLRFTHEQVRHQPAYVRSMLGRVAARLRDS